MHRISVTQALDIWTELMQAYHGQNNYGSDVAEIYLFRVAEGTSPTAEAGVRGNAGDMGRQAVRDQDQQCTESLYALLRHFEEKLEATITIGDTSIARGRKLGRWFLKEGPWEHRVHVAVYPKVRRVLAPRPWLEPLQ